MQRQTPASILREVKSVIREPYAWPGGYAVAFICDDGGVLCPTCAKENAPLILRSIRAKARDGWRVVACESAEILTDSDAGTCCDHCAVVIDSL